MRAASASSTRAAAWSGCGVPAGVCSSCVGIPGRETAPRTSSTDTCSPSGRRRIRNRLFDLLHTLSGSTWDGLQNLQYLAQLLPYAHAAGLKVYGWDFPRLANPAEDVFRAKLAVNYVTASGDRLDGFAADIETPSEGTQFTAAAAQAYGDSLRAAVGRSTLLVAVVPNPTPQMRRQYSYDAVLPAFDAVAPMVYWLNRDPGQDTADALHFLSRYGLPLLPIGQAYDGGREGGRGSRRAVTQPRLSQKCRC